MVYLNFGKKNPNLMIYKAKMTHMRKLPARYD